MKRVSDEALDARLLTALMEREREGLLDLRDCRAENAVLRSTVNKLLEELGRPTLPEE